MFGHPWFRPSLVLLGFAMLGIPIACGSGGGSTNSSSTNDSSSRSSTPAPNNGGVSDNPVVARAIQVQNQLRDLSATIHIDGTQGGSAFTSDGTLQWTSNPERLYTKSTNSLSHQETEVFVDTPSRTTYIKGGSAHWVRAPVGGSPQGGSFTPTVKGDAFRGFRVVGKETVQGKATWHLTGPVPDTSGSTSATSAPNSSGTLDVWVGQSDYLLVKEVQQVRSTDAGGLTLKADAVVNSVNSGLDDPASRRQVEVRNSEYAILSDA